MRIILLAALTMTPVVASAQTAPAANVAAAFSSSTTPIGTLLDNPAARAILDKHIEGFTANDQIELARGRTLRQIQPFVADVLTDEVLAKVDADLAKLNTKP